MSEVTQMDLIKASIEYHAQGASNKDITKNILNEWRGCNAIRDMQEAEMYFNVKNTNIDTKTRSYTDENGKLVENKTLSNVKAKTAQYRKSVNQKYNFALAKPFVISCDNDKYKEEWENFLTDKIIKVIQRTGKAGINKGIGWSYPWINELGELEIVDIQPETIYPAWHDIAHTELDFIVRDYILKEYVNMTAQDIRKVEFWDRKIIEKYRDYSLGFGTGDLVPDTNGEYELGENEERATIQKTHLTKKDGTGESWDRVPFLWFKGNDEELPLLNECKSDIDSYDMVKSKAIDSVIDDIDPIIVIEGIGAEMGELQKAREMIKNSGIMTIDPGGDAKYLKVDANITAAEQELEIIRKDIIDNTSTVDLTSIQLGTNPSGEAMKAFYEALNTWCNGYEAEFRVYMENLKYFFDKWLSWRGGLGSFEELQKIAITFTLDRDMMINETSIIDNVVKLDGKLSQRTLDEMNPWVEDPDKEQERRDEEEKKMMEKQELYQFEHDVDEDNEKLEEEKEETKKITKKEEIKEKTTNDNQK